MGFIGKKGGRIAGFGGICRNLWGMFSGGRGVVGDSRFSNFVGVNGWGSFCIGIALRKSWTLPLVTVAGLVSMPELVDVRLLFRTFELLLLLVWEKSNLRFELRRFCSTVCCIGRRPGRRFRLALAVLRDIGI